MALSAAEIEQKRADGEAVCENCGSELGTCPRCQGGDKKGERYCYGCDWCEACGRSGTRVL